MEQQREERQFNGLMDKAEVFGKFTGDFQHRFEVRVWCIERAMQCAERLARLEMRAQSAQAARTSVLAVAS